MKGKPLVEWKSRTRRGLPQMTRLMFDVLVVLRDALATDAPFAVLDAHKKTIRTLDERDWIFTSPGLDGVRYKITGRGLKALKVYEPDLRRGDGICPRCGVNPRRVRKTGVVAPYCPECESRMGKRKYKLGIGRLKPDGVCSRCHKRPRYVTKTGRVYCYCQHCKNVLSRREHKRKRRQLYQRVLAGEHFGCCQPGCDEPRYLSGKTLQDYCYRHFREYMNSYNDRRRPHSQAALQRQ